MDKDLLIGIVTMCFCCFGSGLLFWGLGIWSEKSKKPMGFWAGSEIAASRISDISGYNHANAVMWKWYSLPYWIGGIVGCFGYMTAAGVIMFLAAFPGIPILISQYKRIEKQFFVR